MDSSKDSLERDKHSLGQETVFASDGVDGFDVGEVLFLHGVGREVVLGVLESVSFGAQHLFGGLGVLGAEKEIGIF